MAKVLLVDDEDSFRIPMAQRLNARGFETIDINNGEDAIKQIRSDEDIDVIVLDRKMQGMSGEQTLQEIKQFRPEIQVIILTGFGSLDSAIEVGKMDAFSYLQKPCDLDELIEAIKQARQEKIYAMARHEIPDVQKGSFTKWLTGTHNSRPGIILLGVIIFLIAIIIPAPERMVSLLTFPKTGEITDINLGYSGYAKMKIGESVSNYYGKASGLGKKVIEDNETTKITFSPEDAAFRAKIMLAILIIAAMFWATGAVPVGITALLVGAIMYFTGILAPDDIAQAYAKDAVIFIFGVLALSVAISKTGLDRRIGLLLLSSSTNLTKLLFIFLPLIGVACSFVSEHAMVAFIMPLLIIVYSSSIREAGMKIDRNLAVILVLSLSFAANSGGPGSPAAGGRNVVMIGILSDYNMMPTFGQWVQYGLPFVPVMCLVIGAYFYIFLKRKVKVGDINVSSLVHQASEKIGPMNKNEYITAIALILLIVLWISSSHIYGLGGPVILCIIILNILRVLRWKDIAKIHWEVVALYASACALGKGLALTGSALYMADAFINILPDFLRTGEGLAIATSLFTGIVTNFMSDGATVAAIGPITIPMAMIAGSQPYMIGFATAFASSFAHMFIIGTPNNAIAFAMSKDPITGEQLVRLSDFFKHGFAVLILSFLVLWFWTIMGYWRWIGF